MPVGELAGVKGSVFDLIGERMLGARAGDILGSSRSSAWPPVLNAWTFAGPRVYYAMARDGVFFPAAARVHPQLQDAARVDRRAGRVGERADSDGQPRHAGQLRRVRHHAVRRHCRRGGVRAARARAERAAPVQDARISRSRRRSSCSPALRSCSTPSIASPGPSGLGLLVIGPGIPLYMWLTRGGANAPPFQVPVPRSQFAMSGA